MIPKLEFGPTGHISTRTLFGAAALGRVDQADADRTLEVLLEYGINHIDTAASYGDSELRIGPWMKNHRDDFFLATKTGERTYDKAKEELHNSLERLQVDYVDLWQMHCLVEDDEWETAMGEGGVLQAFIEAKEQGLVRYLGVTGHGIQVADMHLRSLERFDFDSVLLPYNFTMMQNPQYASSVKKLFALCQERGIAIQTIKSIARGPWGEKERSRSTWYEPLEDQADIDQAVHWVLGQPGIFLNTAGDINLLPRVLDAASRFQEGTGDESMAQTVEALAMEPLFV